jgi:hypothetical protein
MSVFSYDNPLINAFGKTIERRPRIHRIHLTNVASAEVDLATIYKNVTRIELIFSYISVADSPTPGTVTTPSYIVVKIDGMQQHAGNTSALNNAFCTLTKTGNASTDMATTVDLYEYDRGAGGPDFMYTYEMPQPKNITKLNISFYDPTGAAVTLANNNNLLIFELMESTNYGQ